MNVQSNTNTSSNTAEHDTIKAQVQARLRSHQRKRWFSVCVVIVLCVSIVSTGLFILEDSLLYFRVPSDVLLDPPTSRERIRLGGVVEEDSVQFTAENYWQFSVSDGRAVMRVYFAGVLPDLFQEGQGMIAEGYYREGSFWADMILAKHDENYAPRSLDGQNLLEAGYGRVGS